MKITIENSTKIVELDGVPARIWEGATESGIKVHCFVTRIVPLQHERYWEFEKELSEMRRPSVLAQAIPLKMVL